MPHDIAAPPHLTDGDNGLQPRARDAGMAASQSLIDELEDAIAKQDLHRRAAVMRRLTDFFIRYPADLVERQSVIR